MGQVSKFLRRTKGGYTHICPGCGNVHMINTDAPNSVGAQWTFDGNVDSPTFKPSVNVRTNMPDMQHYQPHAYSSVCHYNLVAGQVSFCPDSTHQLAGQIVPLPELPIDMTDHYLRTAK